MTTQLASLPKAQSSMVDASGRPTREFYYFFQQVVSGIEGQITDLSAIVNSLVLISTSLGSPTGSAQEIIDVVNSLAGKVDATRIVAGAMSLAGGGTLDGDVILTLVNDLNDPGASAFYGTDDSGNRGWQPQGIPSYLTTDDLPQGVVNFYDARYTHSQGSASSVWNINHGLGKYPSVAVADSGGSVVIGDISYTDSNNLILTFAAAFAGAAYCN